MSPAKTCIGYYCSQNVLVGASAVTADIPVAHMQLEEIFTVGWLKLYFLILLNLLLITVKKDYSIVILWWCLNDANIS